MAESHIIRVRWTERHRPDGAGWHYRDFESDSLSIIGAPKSAEADAFVAELLSGGKARQIFVTHSIRPEDDLPTSGEPSVCAICGGEVLELLDPSYGGHRTFEARPTKNGRFLLRPGAVSWWGPTGGNVDLHQCPPRDRSAEPWGFFGIGDLDAEGVV